MKIVDKTISLHFAFTQRLLFGVMIIGVYMVFRNQLLSEQNEIVTCERGLRLESLTEKNVNTRNSFHNNCPLIPTTM